MCSAVCKWHKSRGGRSHIVDNSQLCHCSRSSIALDDCDRPSLLLISWHRNEPVNRLSLGAWYNHSSTSSKTSCLIMNSTDNSPTLCCIFYTSELHNLLPSTSRQLGSYTPESMLQGRSESNIWHSSYVRTLLSSTNLGPEKLSRGLPQT